MMGRSEANGRLKTLIETTTRIAEFSTLTRLVTIPSSRRRRESKVIAPDWTRLVGTEPRRINQRPTLVLHARRST